ncbi:lysosome-associated membrane glycoprotein 1-like [Patiria miniata]|uniref:Lysosome-associated membrane glycoprotein 5 n=1 Tax=Patiria miniata TaxID=46514 RepID=A0A913ZH87_PATMI|nr:lysosome-associated membrane glycoprotein 1-like [Patiria miniata]
MEFGKRFSHGAMLLVVVSCLSVEAGMTGVAPNATTPRATNVTTSPAANVTTPTPTTNVTTPTPTTNVTTPLPTFNVTTPSPTSNVTTPSPTSNVTTPSPTSNVTTPRATTTPQWVGNWSVKDAHGAICMWMSFGANLSITYLTDNGTERTKVFELDPALLRLTSNCNSSSTRMLNITINMGPGWAISLAFYRQSGKYSMTEVGAAWVYDNHLPDAKSKGFTTETKRENNFLAQKVALGNYYTCPDPLSVTPDAATVTLWHIQMQPFADKAGGKLGQAEVCTSGLSAGIIVAIAVAGVIVLIGVIVVVVCVVRRKRKTKPYSELENE